MQLQIGEWLTLGDFESSLIVVEYITAILNVVGGELSSAKESG